jgi:hypothetical protein
MGYRPPSTGQVLDFTGTQYEGLEVTVDSVPVGMLLDIGDKAAAADKGDVSQMRELFSLFASVIEAWNVEDRRGEPVQPTLEGLLSQDISFVMAVIGAWITATTSAPPPLPQASPSGVTSPEELTAAAALSRSLPS